MPDRFASLVLFAISLAIAGCSMDVAPASGDLDELRRTSPETAIVPQSDAGMPQIVVRTQPRTRFVPEATFTHDCHDPCPGPCARDEACCAATQRCVSLDCPSCCPDPSFAFSAISTAFGDR